MDKILNDNFPQSIKPEYENFSQSIELRMVRGYYLYDPQMDYRHIQNAAKFAQVFSLLSYEKLLFLFLDINGRLIGTQDFNGNVDQAPFFSSTVVKAALLSNTANVVMVHNHPSVYIDGELKFSELDIKAYDILRTALKLVEVDLIDSVIISGDKYTSYKTQQEEAERLKRLNSYERYDLATINLKFDEAGEGKGEDEGRRGN